MKKILKAVIVSIVSLTALSITSCDKQPTACISIDQSTYDVFDNIQLKSCSIDADKFSWFYKCNGVSVASEVEQKSTEETPVFIPTEDGVWSIELRADSKHQSKDDQTSTTITVKNVCYICVLNNDTLIGCTEDYYYRYYEFKTLLDFRKSQGYNCTKQ